MASDDTSPSEGPKPVERPSRDRHREPPTIEGQAARLPDEAPESNPDSEPVPDPVASAALGPTPEPELKTAPPEPAPPPPPRGGQPLATTAALLALLALLASGGAAYYAWQQSSAAPEVTPAEIAALRSRLDRVESAANRPVASPAELTAVEARVKSLEQRPAPQVPQPAQNASGPALNALQARLDAVEKTARQAAETAKTAEDAAQRPSAPAAPPPPKIDLSPLESRIAALEAKLAAPKSEVRATEDPIAAPRKGDPTALAVVAEALASAVANGRPFTMEMNAAAALGAPPDQLQPLKPLAETGAPSREALSRAFSQVSSKMLAAAEPTAQGNGVLDRLTASAARLVRVRPVGEASGEDGPALVARIEAATARGDAPAALRDWMKLPDAAKSASSAFGDLLRQKVAAETAAHKLLDGAMSALARPKD